MAIGDIYRLDIVWEQGGGVFYGINTFHYQQAEGQVQSSPVLDLAYAATDTIIQALTPLVATTFRTSFLRVRGITNPTEGIDYGFTEQQGSLAGTETYDMGLGALIHWRTELIGRSFRGRTTIPSPTETVVENTGNLSASYRTSVTLSATGIISVGPDTGHGVWNMGVLSRFSGGAERPAPVFTLVTNALVNTKCGKIWQRRD